MAQAKIIRRRSKANGAILRALKNPIYDVMEIPAAAGAVPLIQFFSIQQGGALNVTGVPKTIAETNLTESGSLGSPQEADFWGFNCSVMYDDGYYENGAGGPSVLVNFIDDMVEIYEQSVFEFWFNNKLWYQNPLTKIPHGVFPLTGPLATGSNAAAAAGVHFFTISNGLSSKDEYAKFLASKPHVEAWNEKLKAIGIASKENFNVTCRWPNAAVGLTADGAGTRMTVFLNGVIYTAM